MFELGTKSLQITLFLIKRVATILSLDKSVFVEKINAIEKFKLYSKNNQFWSIASET